MCNEDAHMPVRLEEDVPATMQDGVVLRADIYRPDVSERFPALLMRTPYGKRMMWNRRLDIPDVAEQAAKHGYIVVVQDIRGRYASEGEFYPLFSKVHRDATDGYDTVEWVASLPYCNGRIGTFGGSYVAWTQWQLAPTRPPHLVAMFAHGMAANSLDGNQRGGVLKAWPVLPWMITTMAPDTRVRSEELAGPRTTEEAERAWQIDRGKWLWFLPLKEIPHHALGGLAPYFRDWLDRQHADCYQFEKKHGQIAVPVFHLTGWYDTQVETVKHYVGMGKNGMTAHSRQNQKLMVGPWPHGYTDRKTGDIDFGPDAAVTYVELMVRWFDHWLKGIDNGIMSESPVKIFVMGENVWREEDDWPLSRALHTDYYFHSGGSANTPQGDGILSQMPPDDEPTDSYLYDPRDPVMTNSIQKVNNEPRDQRVLDYRHDVLVFATDPLPQDAEVTGYPVVKLWASSTARDTDFTAKLVDVHADGFAQNLCHGIVRARYRESMEKPTLIRPSEVYEYTIRLQPTSNLFKAGHRIRIDISSSDFPNFDRNHNTGGDDYAETTLLRATQTVYHDVQHASRIILPVIPR